MKSSLPQGAVDVFSAEENGSERSLAKRKHIDNGPVAKKSKKDHSLKEEKSNAGLLSKSDKSNRLGRLSLKERNSKRDHSSKKDKSRSKDGNSSKEKSNKSIKGREKSGKNGDFFTQKDKSSRQKDKQNKTLSFPIEEDSSKIDLLKHTSALTHVDDNDESSKQAANKDDETVITSQKGPCQESDKAVVSKPKTRSSQK